MYRIKIEKEIEDQAGNKYPSYETIYEQVLEEELVSVGAIIMAVNKFPTVSQ